MNGRAVDVTEAIDEHFVAAVRSWKVTGPPNSDDDLSNVDLKVLRLFFEAQMESRHLDFALRSLQRRGEGFYTIGSSGHESNAAVALALRPSDPALLHYRSGGFYAARAGQVPGTDPVGDVINGAIASIDDPISGGRHKVFGNAELAIIPQTSTIASHLPRAVGMAFGLGRAQPRTSRIPEDAVVVCSFGDASANHSTARGALNAAGYCSHQGLPLPLLMVCEDNGIGISTRSPKGWTGRTLSSVPGFEYVEVDGSTPGSLLTTAREVADRVRTTRRPALLHLHTVRLMGHAGSDAELAYRSRKEIEEEYRKDPLLAAAGAMVREGLLTSEQVLDEYEATRSRVMQRAASVGNVPRLGSSAAVMAPLTERRTARVASTARQVGGDRAEAFAGKLPERQPALTLAQSINAALKDLMSSWPQTFVFGEDVATKGGVYGVTRGLRQAFGSSRVFDTLLDEQTILGTALGTALLGFLPVPEIQYLAYLHNAEDQLRGEAASLRFFSNAQYQNGMMVRIAGLAYQKGFGGHFHNDNSVAVLRDVPGLVLAVPSHPATAPALLRNCAALALEEGRVCVFLEPIALYHERDLHSSGDSGWTAEYDAPQSWSGEQQALSRARLVTEGEDVLLVTFGNGVRISLRAA
ncbi:MAG: thiamine pyrophosphate-dependent enzyme, partial [Nocardioidaceae bacterium]